MKKQLLIMLGLAAAATQARELPHKKNERKSHFSSRFGIGSQTSGSINAKIQDAIKQSLDSVVTTSLNPETQQWEVSAVIRFAYNPEGKVEHVREYKIISGNEQLTYSEDYTYNAQGRKQTETYVSYDEEVFHEKYSFSYTYNADGTVKSVKESAAFSEEDPLEVISNTEYVYESGLQKTELHYNYDPYEDTFEHTFKVDIVYGLNNQIKEKNAFVYDADLKAYASDTVSREKFVYDAAGNITVHTFEYVSVANEDGSLQFGNKEEATWDAYKNQTSLINYSWDEDSGKWIPEEKYNFTVDLSVPLTSLIVADDIYQQFNRKLTHVVTSEFIEGTWVVTAKDSVYYSDFKATGLADNQLSDAGLYLSADNTLRASDAAAASEVTVYDLQGRPVASGLVSAQGMSLQSLTLGMYVYTVNTGNKIQSGKLLLK